MRLMCCVLIAGIFLSNPSSRLQAADPVGPDAKQYEQVVAKGVAFLTSSQAADGSYTSPQAPGISALCLLALLKSGVKTDNPAVEKGIRHLMMFKQEDGGIYHPKSHHANYETALIVLVLQAANQEKTYDKTIADGVAFLRKSQWGGEQKAERDDPKYGGAGYGKTGDRPDLSNTTFFLEALQGAGVKSDDPAVQRALVFLSRCQNLESEHNTTAFATKVRDGGFYYTPAAGGSSQAGADADGGLRSYGSMTYAGLKSMIYAGVTADDPRVKAATEWIRKHYSVKENPGLGDQGVYYYFQVFAKSLAAVNVDYFEDAAGNKHDWRKELAEHLASLQQENGAWTNKNSRWYEGDPNLATAFSLIALHYCKPAK